MKVMVDLDRVVFECPSFLYWLGNVVFTRSNQKRRLRYCEVDAARVRDCFNSLFIFKESQPQFFTQVDNSIDVLKKWHEQGIEIHFVSSRPRLRSLQKSAVVWLAENEIEYERLVYACTNKSLYCKQEGIDIMIDDTLQNCVDARKKGVASVWFGSGKRKPNCVKCTTSWEEIDGFVQKKYQQKLRRQVETEIE